MRKLTDNQMSKLQNVIQCELTKRGFHADLVVFAQEPGRNDRTSSLVFTTETFQTVPVIFESIRISEFNGFIKAPSDNHDDSKADTERLSIYISLVARYAMFSGGSNLTELFDVRATADETTIGNIRIS